MLLGFLTASLPRLPLADVVRWAAAEGFQRLELAAWPHDSERDYLAHHVLADGFTQDNASEINQLLDEFGLGISAMAYYENNLHPDAGLREGYLKHLRLVIDAAEKLGVSRVGTFVGARPDRTPAENIKEIGEVFRGITSYAADRGVRVMIENCPMLNWVQFGLPGNYAWSPELWTALFTEVQAENFGLNLDPSHLHWLGIDPVRAVEEFADKIFHVHAKDTEMLPAGRHRVGVLAEQLGNNIWHSGWWRYRLPGHGEIDWRRFVGALRKAGYDDVLSIEHEDPEYEGSEALVKEGLSLGRRHLASIL